METGRSRTFAGAGRQSAEGQLLDPHFEDVGPFYGDDGACLQLGGISERALSVRRQAGAVLGVLCGDGTWLYPAWQFTGVGQVHEPLVPVLAALRDTDRWQAALWLVAPHPELEGRSPRRALAEHAPPDLIATLASHDAAQLP